MEEFKAYASETVGAYYGCLTILSYNNKFYIAVQNHCGYDWVEIKEAYFKQTLKCKSLKMTEITNEKGWDYEQITESLQEIE